LLLVRTSGWFFKEKKSVYKLPVLVQILTANLTTAQEAKAHSVSFSYADTLQLNNNSTYLIKEIDDDTVWFPAFWY
jgi:hypothetical protein